VKSCVSQTADWPEQGTAWASTGISISQGVALKGAEESDKWQKESPPIESRRSEQTPSRSKLSLREESRCSWIYS